MTKSWMSGGKSDEAIEKIRGRLKELEEKREALVREKGRKVFEWASYVLTSPSVPKKIDELRHDPTGQELRDVIALYDILNQEILDKEASLGEKLDEQTRYDSLG